MDPALAPLTLIGGPAILTNACAILQNSATMRYTTAVAQWREFRSALAANANTIRDLYADADRAVRLAERRIRLLLIGLNLLYGAVGLFGFTALLGLFASLVPSSSDELQVWLTVISAIGGVGALVLLLATAALMLENRCTHALLNLQLARK